MAGKDYPSNLMEFQEFFPTEAACRRYLAELRSPQGFVCPKCGEQSGAWDTGRGVLLCRACPASVLSDRRHDFRGHENAASHVAAAWEVTSHKYGASALGVQHAVGLPHYKTAWAWLHKTTACDGYPLRVTVADRVRRQPPPIPFSLMSTPDRQVTQELAVGHPPGAVSRDHLDYDLRCRVQPTRSRRTWAGLR